MTSEAHKAWYKKNKKRVSLYHKDYYVKNKDKIQKYHKRFYAARKPRYRNLLLLRRYGISLKRYNEILAEQGGRCAICVGTNGKVRKLAVDHDHACCPGKTSCGKCVRGLVCNACNFHIGVLEKNFDRICAYLRRPHDRSVSKRGIYVSAKKKAARSGNLKIA